MMSQRPADLSNASLQPSRAQGAHWSITRALVWGFGSLVVMAAGIILVLGLGSGYHNTAELVTKNATLVVASISQRVLHQLEPARDEGLDDERRQAAEQQVAAWREAGELPFPDMAPGDQEALAGTLEFPPEGSALHDSKLETMPAPRKD